MIPISFVAPEFDQHDLRLARHSEKDETMIGICECSRDTNGVLTVEKFVEYFVGELYFLNFLHANSVDVFIDEVLMDISEGSVLHVA